VTVAFSAELREQTWPHHQRASRTEFVKGLLAGEVDRRGYAEMVAQHWFVYTALEEAGETMRRDPVAGGFVTDALLRVPALERDLAALLDAGWRTQVVPSAVSRRYVDRIRQVCFTWPFAFIAHHYTRYLGDLSGGQIMTRAVGRNLGLDAATGAAFYDFTGLGDVDAFKEAYRARLDAAPWSGQERAWFIAETTYAYHLNTEVLVELAPLVRAPGLAVAPAA
jgi:heme oxygenase